MKKLFLSVIVTLFMNTAFAAVGSPNWDKDYEKNFKEQEFLPDKISGTAFYEPGKNPREEELRKFLRNLWKTKYNY